MDFVENEQLFSVIIEAQNMSERVKHVFEIINKLSDTCQQRKKEKKRIVEVVLFLQRHLLLEVFV